MKLTLLFAAAMVMVTVPMTVSAASLDGLKCAETPRPDLLALAKTLSTKQLKQAADICSAQADNHPPDISIDALNALNLFEMERIKRK